MAKLGRPKGGKYNVSRILVGATSNLKDHKTFNATVYANKIGRTFFKSLKVGQTIEATMDKRKHIGIIISKNLSIVTAKFDEKLWTFNLGDFVTNDYDIKLV